MKRLALLVATAALALPAVGVAHTTAGPTDLVAIAKSETRVTLDWTQDYAHAYSGYYLRMDGGAPVKYASSEATVADLAPRSTHEFCVSIDLTSSSHDEESAQTCITASTEGDAERHVTSPCAFGMFAVGNWPGACWRPYAASSWLNTPLPANPKLVSNSSAMVAKMLSSSRDGVQTLSVGNSGRHDYFHPYALSKSTDPLYTIRCWRYACPSIEGAQVRIPVEAKPAQGTDKHLTIVDQSAGWLYDLYKTETYGRSGGSVANWKRTRSPSGGDIWIASGGKTHIDGDGRGVAANGATAAKTGLLAGPIRGAELEAGAINHMLFMFVKCTNGRYVYPAQGKAATCSSTSDAPPDGQAFKLAMTDAEIAALPAPNWRKTIYRAMARYGMFVGDTGGSSAFSIAAESDRTYLDYGYEGAMQRFARTHQGEGGIRESSTPGMWYMDLDGIDWRSKLQAIDPCVIAKTC
ncbi:MAG: hypothetical protein M3N47_14720 [Chloroflexota bacterium]|nr:hypothetical protein [Chloroflexota bacterium]